jgi:glutamyl-tRNA synthetase
VGLIRTALFNWACARHHGGTFVFRIEDTDRSRDSEDSYHQLLEALRWLGLDWDEGVEVGGPHGPYRQSERSGIYTDVLDRLRADGQVYESFSTPQEVEDRHRAAGRDPKLGYDNADRALTEADRDRFRDQGRVPVLRLRMPDDDLSFTDLIRGQVTFRAGSVPDFVVARGDGQPLYTLVNPVDDALMGVTHVLRGEDLLSSMPRQLALYRALGRIGVATELPLFGHLPYVMGQGNRKLSKRDPESNLFLLRDRGFLPEGLLNYLALLGWAIAEDRDVFSMAEMVEAFRITDVRANPARFDLAKAEAINAEHIRGLAEADLAARIEERLCAAGVLPQRPTPDQSRTVAAATPLVQTRMQLLEQVPGLLGFLFVADDELEIAEDAWSLVRKDVTLSVRVLREAHLALADLPEWTASAMDEVLRERVVEGLAVKPRVAFAPLRVAISGKRVSPPLWESMELLGRESTLGRLLALRVDLDG